MALSEGHYTLPPPRFDRPTRLAIVVAPYYRDIADALIAGAEAAVAAAGALDELIVVAGALVIPPALRLASRSGGFDG